MGLAESVPLEPIVQPYHDGKRSDNKTALIVSPHAKCKHAVGHTCDSYAAKGAEILQAELSAKDWFVTYFRGDINRTESDLNRRESRHSTQFREMIRGVYLQNLDKQLWIWDVHSYPGTKYSDVPSECVLLLPYNNERAKGYNYKLRDWLMKGRISVILYHSSEENDITLEATEYRYDHVFLLELSEFLSDSRLRYILNRIAEWMDIVVSI